MKTKYTKVASLISMAIVVCACAPASKPTSEEIKIDQDSLCIIVIPDPESDAKQCKVGQKLLFKPMQWGNEQFPVRFAAEYCDLRYSVVITTGAVSCIYKPAEIKASNDSQ